MQSTEETLNSDENHDHENDHEDVAQDDFKALETSDYIRVIEALLFASPEPLSTKDLHERMPEDADVGGLLMDLKEHYEGRGIQLIEIDGHWAFRTASDLAGSLELEKEQQRKLSRAAMETLAIIAYHQPVTRAEIENIRGVATHKGTLDALMESGWIKPGRRRETPGRPLTWVSTTEFLDHFSLESLMDLPGLDELKASGLLDRRPAIDAIPQSADLFDNNEEQSLDEDQDSNEGSPGSSHLLNEGNDNEESQEMQIEEEELEETLRESS